ncbi:sugar kinase [Arthrospiribacter ruber]|uniref:Sugar kinase n=1 Tax=Arthrospiribacter ruber TaxID=2487934 RepID=A0A951IVL0_9BACT|nr:sugar kinase [Arthrospiribacter ruber]MBW3467985.1 sugar kinase [Arthrospiribacter ruber]
MSKKITTIGEIMMRLTTPGHERIFQADSYMVNFGGAEANVAISLAQLGMQAAHVTAFPDNDLGEKAISYLRKMNISTTHIYKTSGRMGLYFLENGTMQRASKIIYDRFDSAFAHFKGDDIDWEKVFENVDWFHWTGITPAISQHAADLLLKALKKAQEKGIKISGDINYRRNLWQYGKGPLDIMPELIRYCDLIVADKSDFENCMDIQVSDWADACFQAKKDFPKIKWITKTKRESISASHNKLKGVLWNGNEILQSKTYEITHIVDRIGGGDAFMAGLIYGLLHFDEEKALEFATAASVLKHGIPGDANLVSENEILDLVHEKNVGKLLR